MTSTSQIQQWAKEAARRNKVDWGIFSSLIRQESGWNPAAVSPAGAIGLGQLMPGTAKGLGVDPYDPKQNLDGAARYLRTQLESFGSYRLALAAYNAGPGAVREYGGVPPYKETQRYVMKVLGNTGTPSKAPVTAGARGALNTPGQPAPVGVSSSYQPPPSADLLTSPAFQALGRISMGEKPTDTLKDLVAQSTASLFDTTPATEQARMPTTQIPTPSFPVPTKQGTLGKVDTSWGGSHAVATSLATLGANQGLKVVSEKRDRKSTASGGVSDHWTGSKDSYAYDLSNSDRPSPEMDKTAVSIARQLGVQYDGQGPLVLTVRQNGYRIQVLYRTTVGGNHFNHIHVGVRRL